MPTLIESARLLCEHLEKRFLDRETQWRVDVLRQAIAREEEPQDCVQTRLRAASRGEDHEEAEA